MTGTLVGHGLATLHELQTIYSYEDALDMIEIVRVRHYNQWAATEAARHGRIIR